MILVEWSVETDFDVFFDVFLSFPNYGMHTLVNLSFGFYLRYVSQCKTAIHSSFCIWYPGILVSWYPFLCFCCFKIPRRTSGRTSSWWARNVTVPLLKSSNSLEPIAWMRTGSRWVSLRSFLPWPREEAAVGIEDDS